MLELSSRCYHKREDYIYMTVVAKNIDYYSTYDQNTFWGVEGLSKKITQSYIDTSLLDAAIFWSTNQERVKYGLKPFLFHNKLREMAILHSEQMRTHSFFGHENVYDVRYQTLTDRLEAVKDEKFNGFYCYAENIADYPVIKANESFTYTTKNGISHMYSLNGKEIFPFTYVEMAKYVVDGWMNSPGHRANILNPDYLYLGCGCAPYEDSKCGCSITYFKLTQNFGGNIVAPSILGSIKQSIGAVFNPHGAENTNKSKYNALFGGWRQSKINAMMKNEKQWSSATPGLLIILIDQSGSMLQQYEGTDTRTEFASRAVNRVIQNIIDKNFDGDAPKNRCFISVIGYNHNVKDLCSGWLKDIAAKPLRYENLKKKMPDGAGGIVEVDVQQPVWVEPIKNDGATNMLGALQLAKDLAEKWIADNPQYPAPVIINISDGVPYYDGKDPRECMQETISLAKEIMSLSNEDGNVLIFNAQIDNKGNNTEVFPSDRSKLSQEEAQFLFDITSEVPESYKSAAAKNELPVEAGSRGCIFNADGVQLIQLIDFGSSKGQGDKGLQ